MAPQVYTREQRINAMRAAGWPDEVIPIGVAVSLAESWNGTGINNNPPTEYSVGPWQINLLAHPNVSESQAQDLNYSSQYALQLWQRQGFQPWGAYTNGSYLKYLEPTMVETPSGSTATSPAAVKPPVGSSGGGSPALPNTQTTTTAGVSAPSAFGFTFPTVDLGPIKLDTSGAFKVALSIGALFLVFKGLSHIAE